MYTYKEQTHYVVGSQKTPRGSPETIDGGGAEAEPLAWYYYQCHAPHVAWLLQCTAIQRAAHWYCGRLRPIVEDAAPVDNLFIIQTGVDRGATEGAGGRCPLPSPVTSVARIATSPPVTDAIPHVYDRSCPGNVDTVKATVVPLPHQAKEAVRVKKAGYPRPSCTPDTADIRKWSATYARDDTGQSGAERGEPTAVEDSDKWQVEIGAVSLRSHRPRHGFDPRMRILPAMECARRCNTLSPQIVGLNEGEGIKTIPNWMTENTLEVVNDTVKNSGRAVL
ncbi:hypothetical protein B0H10DRAFT_1963130 [Mycena sp. CBHHK59/15]|nr:hypothetical protein B0H10DRAFT_1963130 [Mycena sp. CBHHK59/15]